MECNVRTIDNLDPFLKRTKKSITYEITLHFSDILKEILNLMHTFVPSEAGSILLDNPIKKLEKPSKNDLTFVAAFGKNSEKILGKKLSLKKGIGSFVYKNKKPYLSNSPIKDPKFDPSWDIISKFKTKSILAVPIKIEKSIIGVIELVNKKGKGGFNKKDLKIVEHLASYTGLAIHSFLDAKRVSEFAIIDELSTLYNDRYFHKKLMEEIKKARENEKELSLIFMDLDNFKSVNDKYGHLAGSQALREVGIILKSTVDMENSIPARYGGDEFVLLLPDVDYKKALEISEKIKKTIKNHCFLSKSLGFLVPILKLKGVIGASCGVASLKNDIKNELSIEEQKDLLIRLADMRMYKVKRSSKM